MRDLKDWLRTVTSRLTATHFVIAAFVLLFIVYALVLLTSPGVGRGGR